MCFRAPSGKTSIRWRPKAVARTQRTTGQTLSGIGRSDLTKKPGGGNACSAGFRGSESENGNSFDWAEGLRVRVQGKHHKCFQGFRFGGNRSVFCVPDIEGIEVESGAFHSLKHEKGVGGLLAGKGGEVAGEQVPSWGRWYSPGSARGWGNGKLGRGALDWEWKEPGAGRNATAKKRGTGRNKRAFGPRKENCRVERCLDRRSLPEFGHFSGLGPFQFRQMFAVDRW